MKEKKSLLVEFLGENTLTKVIDILLEKRPFDTTKEEIIRETRVSRNSFFKVWKRIEAYNLVKRTRTIGRANLYVLDDNNPIVRKLLELEYSLIENEMKPHKTERHTLPVASRI